MSGYAEKFASAFMGSFPQAAAKLDSNDLTHPQGLLGIDLGNTGFCELWFKYEPQVKRALTILKFFGYGGVATFIQGLLTAAETTIIPDLGCVAPTATTPKPKTNVSQEARP